MTMRLASTFTRSIFGYVLVLSSEWFTGHKNIQSGLFYFIVSATCHNVGITALAAGLLAADHGPLGMERATEHSSCAVNHKTKKKLENSSG